MPTYQLLTDRVLANPTAITPTTLIHIVTTDDVSQNPAGSSYKAELGQLSSLFSGSTFTYEIGQYVADQGGVIAHRWLSTTAGGSPTIGTVQNYLVVDITDLSSSAQYASLNANIPNVESNWDGETNTSNLISAGAGSGIIAGTAAVLCDNSTNNGKNDWYLPAIDELSKIWRNRWDIAQGISNGGGIQLAFGSYWCSSEYDTTNSWFFDFFNGSAGILNKSISLDVRAVRKFNI